MRLAWALLAVVTGCQTTDHPDYPINPGGGTGVGSSGQRDANEGDGDGGATITGKVCVMTDLRRLDTCTTAGANNLVVTIGTKTATTNIAGGFTIGVPAGANLVWRISGAAIVPSVIPFSASTTLFAVDANVYADDLNANGVVLVDQQGSVLARVERNGLALANAQAVSNPPSPNATFYDGNNPTVWDQDATSTFGMVWLPGLAVGDTTVRLTPAAPDARLVVENQAITFVTIDVP